MDGDRFGHPQGLVGVVAAEVDRLGDVGLGLAVVLAGLERLPGSEVVPARRDDVTHSMDEAGALLRGSGRPLGKSCPGGVERLLGVVGTCRRRRADDTIGA